MTYSSLLEDKKTIYSATNTYVGYNGAYSGWYIWKKPDDISLVSIIAVAGGGGGGGGGSINYGTTGGCGGGGSGGAGRQINLLIPAILVPDYLYIFPGTGGAGGIGQVNSISTGTNGADGGDTFVSIQPNHHRYNHFIAVSGGRGGYASVTGRRGSAAIYSSYNFTGCPLLTLGFFNDIFSSYSGLPGNGNGFTSPTLLYLTNVALISTNPGGGGGGIGLSSTSGDINSAGFGGGIGSYFLTQNTHGYTTFNFASGYSASGRCGNTPSAVGNGGNGINLNYFQAPTLEYSYNKFIIPPGGGGGGSLAGYTGNGGDGGWGSPGCGGGGGGATIGGFGYSGGRGGDGGPGYVLITTM